MLNLNTVRMRDAEREELNSQIEEFLRRGGKIKEEAIIARTPTKESREEKARREFTIKQDRRSKA